MSVLHGDARFYNNVFVQQKVRQGMIDICRGDENGEWDDGNLTVGTTPFNGFMKEDEWSAHFSGYCGEGAAETRDRYYMPLPVWFGGNAYFNGAKPCELEEDCTVDTEHEISLKLRQEGTGWKVETNLTEYLPHAKMISSDTLGMAFEPEQRFEGPDGEDIVFNTDFHGKTRPPSPVAGPFCRE